MLCFTQAVYADPMIYCFESFPIEKLTRLSLQGKLLEPKEKFVWREMQDDSSDACTPHCFGTSFVQVGDLIYAAGGFKTDEEAPEYSFIAPRNLPREFSCISLSTPLENSRAKYKSPMHGGDERAYNNCHIQKEGEMEL